VFCRFGAAESLTSQSGRGANDLMAVKEGWRGRFYEDFEVGDIYEHPL
jgi:hypothetical protein